MGNYYSPARSNSTSNCALSSTFIEDEIHLSASNESASPLWYLTIMFKLLREKFSYGPGFKPSLQLYTLALKPTELPRRITGSS